MVAAKTSPMKTASWGLSHHHPHHSSSKPLPMMRLCCVSCLFASILSITLVLRLLQLQKQSEPMLSPLVLSESYTPPSPADSPQGPPAMNAHSLLLNGFHPPSIDTTKGEDDREGDEVEGALMVAPGIEVTSPDQVGQERSSLLPEGRRSSTDVGLDGSENSTGAVNLHFDLFSTDASSSSSRIQSTTQQPGSFNGLQFQSHPDPLTCIDVDVPRQKKLKVFVYKLPRKLNFGLFNRRPEKAVNRSSGEGGEVGESDVDKYPWGELPAEEGTLPPKWPWSGRTHPTAKQHSMEYYIVADLLYPVQMRHPNVTAVRVFDPNDAHVFLVPVFSSLLVNVYRRRRFDVYTRLAQELAEFLSVSPWWQRSGGRDHIIPVHHPCALETIRDWMSGAIFAVVDFARFHPATANPTKDIVHPYNQLVLPYSRQEEEEEAQGSNGSPFDKRQTLLYFQGSLAGRPQRRSIVEALQGDQDVHVQDVKASLESIKQTQAGMRSSKFCLHVVGDTPSASRLFSAIVSGCLPVIISDSVDLPFESVLNYAHFALFFQEQASLQKGYVVEKLRAVTKEQWMGMWNELRRVQHHFLFQVPSLPGDAVDMMWKQVQQKLPWLQLSTHRDRRLRISDWWDSETFSDTFVLRRSAHRKKNQTLPVEPGLRT